MRLFAGKAFAVLLSSIALGSIAALWSDRWLPQPASQHSSLIDAQFHGTLINTAIALAIAQGVLAILAWRFQAAKKQPVRVLPNGVAIALVVAVGFIATELVGAATLGRRAWAALYPEGSVADPVRVQAMGQQFAFYFRYPGGDGQFGPIHVQKIDPSIGNYFGLDANDRASRDDVVAASLVLPVNRPAELMLDSEDVIHSFYVRELRIQQDMVPGMHIPVRFTPTKTGTYEIVCTQLCGLGHYRMRAYLQVVSEQDFEKWMKAHARPPQ